jgi:hypothetical protein
VIPRASFTSSGSSVCIFLISPGVVAVQGSQSDWHASTFCESDGDKDLDWAAGATSPCGASACGYHGRAFARTAKQDCEAGAG